MNFSELIRNRQSVRRYDPRPVEKEKLMQCLEAARLSPSASNSQPWSFVVVDEPGLKNKLAEATYGPLLTFNKFTLQAPVIIVMIKEEPGRITRYGAKIKNRDWSQIDAGIAAAHLCLQAAELGLGTCMIGWFNEKKVKELLNIPAEKFVSLLISLGYPPENYRIRNKSRKAMEVITGLNAYKGR